MGVITIRCASPPSAATRAVICFMVSSGRPTTNGRDPSSRSGGYASRKLRCSRSFPTSRASLKYDRAPRYMPPGPRLRPHRADLLASQFGAVLLEPVDMQACMADIGPGDLTLRPSPGSSAKSQARDRRLMTTSFLDRCGKTPSRGRTLSRRRARCSMPCGTLRHPAMRSRLIAMLRAVARNCGDAPVLTWDRSSSNVLSRT